MSLTPSYWGRDCGVRYPAEMLFRQLGKLACVKSKYFGSFSWRRQLCSYTLVVTSFSCRIKTTFPDLQWRFCSIVWLGELLAIIKTTFFRFRLLGTWICVRHSVRLDGMWIVWHSARQFWWSFNLEVIKIISFYFLTVFFMVAQVISEDFFFLD